jgi:drug/metabolite transporter (DMT)-like permease
MSDPDPDPRSHLRALATALFVTVLWSSSWVLIRVGLDDESLRPITFAGLRYTLAAGVLLVVAVRRPASRRELAALDRSGWRSLVVLGVVFYAVTQGAQFVAIDNQPAATTSLTLAPTPFLVAILSRRSIGESVHRRQIAGAALMGFGAALYFAGGLGATVLGMAAAGVGLSANVASSLLGRSVNRARHLAPLTVTAASMTVGALLLLAAGLAVEGMPRLSGTAVLLVVWLAVVNTALAFTLWNASLRRLAAVESAAVNNTMLVQIALLAWIFLGEPPGLLGWLGIVVVSAGALLAQGGRSLAPWRR